MYLSGVVHYSWQLTNPEEAGGEMPVSFQVMQELQGISHQATGSESRGRCLVQHVLDLKL